MAHLSEEIKIKLYREMSRLRVVEEKIADFYSEQEMRCPVHLSIGQEAAAVGSGLALRKTDYSVSGHRSHGHYLAKGGRLKAMLAEIYGKAAGCAGGKGGSMHLTDPNAGFLGSVPIVGSTIPIGVGAAFGSSLAKEDRVTMINFGDGATEAGVFHESLNFAAVKKLPIVFLCENNLYSVYSPMHVRQPLDRTIAGLANAHGIESHSLDGNDVEVVYKQTMDAVDKARHGNGPVFLELMTYRWREHCGPNFDNHLGYRTEEEYQKWLKLDPVARYEEKLKDDNILNDKKIKELQSSILGEVMEAFNFAKKAPFPEASCASQFLYAS